MEEMSPVTPAAVPPMPRARAPTPIFRNCADVVPTFAVVRNSWALEGVDQTTSRAAMSDTADALKVMFMKPPWAMLVRGPFCVMACLT